MFPANSAKANRVALVRSLLLRNCRGCRGGLWLFLLFRSWFVVIHNDLGDWFLGGWPGDLCGSKTCQFGVASSGEQVHSLGELVPKLIQLGEICGQGRILLLWSKSSSRFDEGGKRVIQGVQVTVKSEICTQRTRVSLKSLQQIRNRVGEIPADGRSVCLRLLLALVIRLPLVNSQVGDVGIGFLSHGLHCDQ